MPHGTSVCSRDRRRIDLAVRAAAANGFEFRRVHQSVLFRQVAVAQAPPQRPHQSDQPANQERPAPAEIDHDQQHQRRRDRSSGAAGAVGDALHEAAFAPRIPKLHRARRAGECAGFADAEQEAQHDERGRAERQAGRGGHDRPIGDDGSQHAARAEAIAQPAARHLEQRIGPDEGGEDVAHRDIVEAEFLADLRRRGRDVDAVEISDEVHHADQKQNVPAAAARLRVCWLRHVFAPRSYARCRKSRELCGDNLPVYRRGGKGSVLRRMSFTSALRYNPAEANLGQST